MTYDEVMAKIQSLGTEKGRKINERNGVSQAQFGAKMGDLRGIAKEIGSDPELVVTLWNSGNFDAQMVATLLMKPKALDLADVEELVAGIESVPLADWFVSYVVKQHSQKEALREPWMRSAHEITARLGWSLTAERICKTPDGLSLSGLLDRLDQEMPAAPTVVQWTMNYCLAEIGINFPEFRARALEMGERIGAFRDYPTPKGCTSPFAPIWIAEMVSRQG